MFQYYLEIITPFFFGIGGALLIVTIFLQVRANNYLNKNYPNKRPYTGFDGPGFHNIAMLIDLARKYPDWYSSKWWFRERYWRWWEELPQDLKNDATFVEMRSKALRFGLYTAITSLIIFFLILMSLLQFLLRRP
jgi:hypothetical protein